MWWITLPIIAYLLIALPLWRKWAGAVAAPIVNDKTVDDYVHGARDEKSAPAFDWGYGIFVGGLGASIWPVVVVCVGLTALYRRFEMIMSTAVPRLMGNDERKARAVIREIEIQRGEKATDLDV